MSLVVLQILPALDVGGVERGTLEVAHELVRRGFRSIVISGGGHLVEQLINEGSQHITMSVGKKSLFSLQHIPELRQILKEEKASIVHVRSRFPAWLTWFALKGLKDGQRPRFITTVHGPYTVNRYSRIMMHGERIIAISEFIKDYILENYPGIDPGRIHVIHRGVDSAKFPHGYQPPDEWYRDWHKQHPALIDKFVVTLPARITRWKGQEDFIQIIAKALSAGIPVHGLIAGGAHPRRTGFLETLKSRVKKMGIANEFSFLGHRNDMKEIMAVSDVILSLAREPEAFGRTALEALCLGKPVIAYNHGGAAEVLREIFPQGLTSPFGIQEAVNKLGTFYKHRPVVPDKNPFTLDKMLNKTIETYQDLTSQHIV